MQMRWLGALIGTMILAVVLAFVLPAHPSSAGSLDQEAEHEPWRCSRRSCLVSQRSLTGISVWS
jgi:hypothetical protein